MRNPILLNGEFKEKSFSRVFRYLNERKDRLSRMHQQLQLHQPVDSIRLESLTGINLTGINMVCLLNYLLLEFQVFRDEYAVLMFDVAAAIKQTDVYRGNLVMSNLRQLNSSVITFPEEPEADTTATSNDTGSVIGLVAAIIVIIIRIASCSTN